MLYTQRPYDDCRIVVVIAEPDFPGEQGAYAYDCPVCRRGGTFGVVSRLLPVSRSGKAKGPKAVPTV